MGAPQARGNIGKLIGGLTGGAVTPVTTDVPDDDDARLLGHA
jgi:hypothetical protein